MTKKDDEPKYQYVEQVRKRIPILNLYPDEEQLKAEAQEQATKSREIHSRCPAHGGRAG